MYNTMSSDEVILHSYGGYQNNSLRAYLHLDDNDDINELSAIKHSSYYDIDQFKSLLQDNVNSFSILSSNIESINSKITDIQLFVEELRQNNLELSAICLQECWISDSEDISHIEINGYQCIRQGKSCSNKGGLIIYLLEKFNYDIMQSYNTSDVWEGQFVRITGGGLTNELLIGNIYRPPRDLNINYKQFIEELTPLLSLYNKNNSEMILTGDFNINLLKVNEREVFGEFFETLISSSFYPRITLPTRFSNRNGTLIDNFFCRLTNSMLGSKSGILINQFSDHHPYFISINKIKHKDPPPKTISVTKYTPYAINNFCTEIAQSNIIQKINTNPFANPNNSYEIIENIVSTAKEKHMPCRTVKINKYKHKREKWITYGILRSIRYKDKLYKTLKTTPTDSNTYTVLKHNFNIYNAILKKSIRNAKKLYYESCFNRYKSDIKNTWSTINNILNRNKRVKSFPQFFKDDGIEIENKLLIANKFNNFFTNIGPKLAEQIDTPTNYHFKDYLSERLQYKFKFEMVDEPTVNKIIEQMTPKTSCGHDNISMKMLKTLKNILLEPLTININQMLNTGIFPDRLKIARVKPLYKKDDSHMFTNYRPISLLPAISKIFEKIIFIQLYAYFVKNNLFFSSQYGFRSEHSTEFAALELVDRIIQQLDQKEIPFSIFLDLSKAFDTLDHNILLEKLTYYGVTGMANNLIKSYLTDRKQFVEFDGVKSDMLNISTGVPQGSVLGPLLFIIYLNDISHVSKIFKLICYADDTSIFSTFSSFKSNTTDTNSDRMINKELEKINYWLKVNKLSLNVNKTKFMVFHPHQKRVKKPDLFIDGIKIECISSFNFLGITINDKMSWKDHIDTICGKISRAIGILNRLKHFLPLHAKLCIYNSLILPHINYGILLWGHTCDRILKLQKKAMRIITLSKYNAHTDPLFKLLNLLKVQDIFKVFQMKFYHNYVNNKLPNYFDDLPLAMNNERYHYNTRIRYNMYTGLVNHEFAKKSLRYCLPNTINSTPMIIKEKIFTHSLKGFSLYFKNSLILSYSDICTVPNCYVCMS